ncbi:MAG TPA: DedA family protein [Thermoanaerobaculia bacterium]|nr:DedA family protein [Thermoanaerobaculia bacterium]
MLELITLALGTLISEEVACVTAGLLVASGRHSFFAVTVACISGIYAGDLLYYGLGRLLGMPLISRLGKRWEHQVRKAIEWFEKHGTTAVLTARFLPGTRVPAYMAAGAMGMSFARFSTFFLIAAIIWTPILVGSSAFLGVSLQSVGWGAQIGAGIFLVALVRGIMMIRDKRSRRIMAVRWWRLKRRFRSRPRPMARQIAPAE